MPSKINKNTYSRNYKILPNGHILFGDLIFMVNIEDNSGVLNGNELHLNSKLTFNIRKNCFEKEAYFKIIILNNGDRLEIVRWY